jgi:hypothetical protein
MATATVTPFANSAKAPAGPVTMLAVADELCRDRSLAHAAYSAAEGLSSPDARGKAQNGLITLLDLIVERLDERCAQLDEFRGRAAA